MDPFVDAYASATGKKHRVPTHFLTHPRFSKRFRKTPSQKAAETAAMGSATPATDVVTTPPASTTTPTTSTTETPAAGAKE